MEVTPAPTQRPEAGFAGRIRFRDGRPPDLLSVPLLVDSFTPAVFRLGHVGWSPTIELTVHLRNRPTPGWLTATVRTTMLERGIFEEDVELWDSTNTLVAHSRQLQLTTR